MLCVSLEHPHISNSNTIIPVYSLSSGGNSVRPDYLLIFSFDGSGKRSILFKTYESLRLLVLGETELKTEFSNYKRESISQISPLDWDEKALLARLDKSAA